MPGSVQFFSHVRLGGRTLSEYFTRLPPEEPLERVARALDFVQLREGILAVYDREYPLVETRELIPSFDAPLIEYKRLPAFSMVLLDRALSYQDEGFQYDQLLPEGRPATPGKAAVNRRTLRRRLPRNLEPEMDAALGRKSVTRLVRYPLLLRFFTQMDRGHVVAREPGGHFHVAGIYASFPSDLDGEIKRFGRAIGKFAHGDNDAYAQNRLMVYRFLMEQAGFPISGERHTSAALFARRLMRRREHFVVKVLGNSDRALTNLTSLGAAERLPRVEKFALVQAVGCSAEGYRQMEEGGWYVDPGRQVVLLKVSYMQHAYHKDNVLEDRALSVLAQELVHPRTGEIAPGRDILALGQDRLLLLNDIVRGEYLGSIVYKGRERVEGTAGVSLRLKFLQAWLTKHRHLLADYSPDNFEQVLKVVFSFLEAAEHAEEFERHKQLYREARSAVADLRVAHRLRLLEKLVRNRADSEGRKLPHVHLLIILVHVLSQEGPILAKRHPHSLRKLLRMCRRYLADPYLRRRYMESAPRTKNDREARGEIKLLTKLVEKLEARLVRGRPKAR